MTTAVAPDRESHHSEDQQPTTPGRDGADKAGQELDTRSFDPTQGRTIGSDPYDDPTQGRTIGSNPYDDPTQGRTIGSNPYDDPTQGRKIGSNPYDDPTQGRKIGSNPYDDPTRARTKTQPRLIKPVPVSTTNNLRPSGTRRSQQ